MSLFQTPFGITRDGRFRRGVWARGPTPTRSRQVPRRRGQIPQDLPGGRPSTDSKSRRPRENFSREPVTIVTLVTSSPRTCTHTPIVLVTEAVTTGIRGPGLVTTLACKGRGHVAPAPRIPVNLPSLYRSCKWLTRHGPDRTLRAPDLRQPGLHNWRSAARPPAHVTSCRVTPLHPRFCDAGRRRCPGQRGCWPRLLDAPTAAATSTP